MHRTQRDSAVAFSRITVELSFLLNFYSNWCCVAIRVWQWWRYFANSRLQWIHWTSNWGEQWNVLFCFWMQDVSRFPYVHIYAVYIWPRSSCDLCFQHTSSLLSSFKKYDCNFLSKTLFSLLDAPFYFHKEFAIFVCRTAVMLSATSIADIFGPAYCYT